jgi:hypothetical protein
MRENVYEELGNVTWSKLAKNDKQVRNKGQTCVVKYKETERKRKYDKYFDENPDARNP